MIERNGNCWKSAFECLLKPPLPVGLDFEPVLVHGLPTGTLGEAAKVGVYCHAWIEYPDLNVVYDTESDVVVPRALYYKVGKIEYTKQYTVSEALALSLEFKILGPWDDKIIARDAEIDKISERGGLRNG